MFAQIRSLFLRSAPGHYGAMKLVFLHFIKCRILEWEAHLEKQHLAQRVGTNLSPNHQLVVYA